MSQSFKILVIDDQEDFLETLSFWLRTKGYEVKSFVRAVEGVEALKKGGFDLVILDFQMPGMDGIEAITKIREFDKKIPVLILTAYADSAIIREIKRFNVAGFFSKMEKLDELQQTIDVLLRGLRRTKSPA